MTKPDSIILDIDGTLWDSTQIVMEAWNETISKHSDVPIHFTKERMMQLFGKTLDEIANLSFPFLDEEKRHQLMDACCEQEEQKIRESKQNLLFPQVEETIHALYKQYPLFIVSNCQAGYIELFLEKTGLGPYITDFECPGNTGLEKGPNIKLIIERNHLKHPVYVGDTEGDYQASCFAKIPFCFASYGFGKVEQPDYLIHHFSDLLTLF